MSSTSNFNFRAFQDYNSGRVSVPDPSVAKYFIVPVQTTQSGRVVNPVNRLDPCASYVPGSNNGYTSGRTIDPYVRK